MDYLVAGIDPGSFGGISLLDETGVAIKALPTPCSQIVKGGKLRAQIDIAQAYAVLMEFKAIAESKGKRLHICLEKVEAMFTDGAKSAFAFGRNIGMWEGIVVASQCPYSFVTPPAWKREMISKTVSNAKMPQGKKSKKKLREHGRAKRQVSTMRKMLAVETAKQLFPLALINVKKKNLDGIAESLLIAEWARRSLLGTLSKNVKNAVISVRDLAPEAITISAPAVDVIDSTEVAPNE
jgi:hypothetical protein